MSGHPNGWDLAPTRKMSTDLDTPLSYKALAAYERRLAGTHSWSGLKIVRELRRLKGWEPCCTCLHGVSECPVHRDGIQMCSCDEDNTVWCYEHGDVDDAKRAAASALHLKQRDQRTDWDAEHLEGTR